MHVHLWTFLFQTVNFLVLVWVLGRLLYRPVQRAVARRQAEIADTLAKADAERAAAAQARADVEQERSVTASARDRLLAEAQAEAEAGRAAVLAETRHEAEEALATERAALDKERAAAAAALRAQACHLAVAVAERLLAGVGSAEVTGAMLDQALAAVKALDARERARLGDEVRGGQRLRVVTATPLDGGRRAACAAELRAALTLGADPGVEFAEDPALLAGAELHLPHAVISQSWRDQLAQVRKELAADEPG